ncbi:hypothetical protein AWM79_03950 [Pseudomonas agarici]|uniref:Uncharacterized protein n=1 Tax=Pseudomonas agarici TaxID=46677 RepID=A0A0X1SXB4_PSEAA|nr:hypothetical protein [Pseudomonas agarici]AMB84506.1 hypothetical protein AWM79_03950 [Pseudomonas agarici]NWB89704.1 hypothetical protein [Pseudomonas agarici]NWC10235.1 hypothetical protein [Pseudomonas agarici]SEK19257.1 hypothetical protein SAMN05216604_10193 [Pseudomonas agarici]
MSKERGILGFMLFLWTFRAPPPHRVCKLSDEERQLVEHYRSLSAEDRNALRCLLNAMESVSRF